ncbi:MAG: hypothetical protein KAW39_06895 [Thermoplasmata archaeon]|nr:hypothetical protein [Thermoplasmata archaeon]
MSAVADEIEVKVLYLEGETLRVFRGVLVEEDEIFVSLKRRDGVVRISKNHIIKIDQRGEEGP